MKKQLLIIAVAAFSGLALPSCKKEIGNLNNPTVEDFLNNASKAQLNNLVTGIESGMRNNLPMYLDVVGVIGREMYRFSGSEPRYTSDLVGAGEAQLDNNTFYLTNPWASRYRVVKNCNLLIEAAEKSTLLTDAERNGYIGFAKTFLAYQLLLNLNMTYNNGIRIDVADPENLGPVVASVPECLSAISTLLEEGKTALTGSSNTFVLTSGFESVGGPNGVVEVNRAIAARVAVYRQQWQAALNALNESFFNLEGDLNTGAYSVFTTGSGDQLNGAYFPQNQNGEVRVAHPSYESDIEANDDRIGKATLRTSPASQSGLEGDRDVWVYTSAVSPIPMIRNEELILIYAEAQAQLGGAGLGEATKALNRVRNAHGLGNLPGNLTQAQLITEMLKQRRYSLFFEGHRWVDMRRYNRLAELPKDRATDDVWVQFPLPLTEQ